MRRYQISIGDKVFDVEILSVRGEQARLLVNGRPYEVKFSTAPLATAPAGTTRAMPPAPPPSPEPAPPRPAEAAAPAGDAGAILAPMPGSILEVLVKVGDQVKVGDTVVKLEAMKMENEVKASSSGVVTDVRVSKGSNVAKGEILLVISQG